MADGASAHDAWVVVNSYINLYTILTSLDVQMLFEVGVHVVYRVRTGVRRR